MSAMSVFMDNAVNCDLNTVGAIAESYILKNDVEIIQLKLYSGDPVYVIPYQGDDTRFNQLLVPKERYEMFVKN